MRRHADYCVLCGHKAGPFHDLDTGDVLRPEWACSALYDKRNKIAAGEGFTASPIEAGTNSPAAFPFTAELAVWLLTLRTAA